jgi:hypothetical protein
MGWRRSSKWHSGPSLSWFSISTCRTCTASTCSSSFETIQVRERSSGRAHDEGRRTESRCRDGRRRDVVPHETVRASGAPLHRRGSSPGRVAVTQTGSPHDDAAFPDFLDDYFAECEEHLTGVRRLLLGWRRRSAERTSIVHYSTNCSVTFTRSRASRAWSSCARRRTSRIGSKSSCVR